MKHRNIAVIATGADTDVQSDILRGIEKYGKEQNCNIAVFHWFTGVYERERHNLGEVNIAYLPDLNLFDGVILFANACHIEENRRRMEELLAEVSCPVVCVGNRMADYYYVGTDNYSAMRKLIEHFVIDHKMTKIHFVKGVAGNVDAEARFQAYVDVLTEHNIPIVSERISQGDFYIVGAELAAQEIFSSSLDFPEAIVCANDTMAITMCNCLKEKGYQVPKDVAVSGYDCSYEGQQLTPRLTTARVSFQEMGCTACKVLLDVADGKDVPKETVLSDEVILGESCGCSNSQPVEIKNEEHGEVFQRDVIHQMIELEKNIMAADGYENWVQSVKDFIAHINPPEFYFCTNDDFAESVFEQSFTEQENMSAEEKMAFSSMSKVLIAYKNGIFKNKEPFESKYAFDGMFHNEEKAKLYFFSPLHFQERNYGYFVFVDSDYVLDNQLYIYWLIALGHSVENIRKQILLQSAMKHLDEMYIRDSLTGAYNRFGMERYFAEIKMNSMLSKSKMQVSFVDIDGLKRINDLYGHEEGDRIINATATILMKNTKKYYVIRYGGDEFIVMGTVQNAREIETYWQKVMVDVETYNTKHKKQATLSMSIGYDVFNVDHKTYLEDCICVSDRKMYEQKNYKKSLGKAEEQIK